MVTNSFVIKVGKHRAVAGLAWMHLAGEQDPLTEARYSAKESGAQWAIVHRSPDFQWSRFGLLSPTAPKEAKGAVSAAMWLAASVESPVLYIEALDDRGSRYWVVAVRPGEVDPRTDAILDETQATERIATRIGHALSATNRETLRVVVGGRGLCPSNPVIDRLDRERGEFASLLKGSPPKEATLVQIAGIKPSTVIALATVIGLIVAGFVGTKLYQEHQQKKRFEEEMARAAFEQARLAELSNITQLRIAEAVRLAAEEESATPNPRRGVEACMASTATFPPMLGGWSLAKIDCNMEIRQATATYNRRGQQRRANPTYEQITRAASSRGLTASIDINQDVASLTTGLELGDPRPARGREGLPVMQEMIIALPSRLQIIENVGEGVGLRVEPHAPRPIMYRDPENEQAEGAAAFKPVPDDQGFSKGRFTLSGNVLWLAESAAKAIELEGVTVQQMTLSTVSQVNYQWSVAATYIGR